MAYESAQAERERHDAEKAAENKARQVRQGVVPASDEEAPKAKAKAKAKPKPEESEESEE